MILDDHHCIFCKRGFQPKDRTFRDPEGFLAHEKCVLVRIERLTHHGVNPAVIRALADSFIPVKERAKKPKSKQKRKFSLLGWFKPKRAMDFK